MTDDCTGIRGNTHVSIQLFREFPHVLLEFGRVGLLLFKALHVKGHQLKVHTHTHTLCTHTHHVHTHTHTHHVHTHTSCTHTHTHIMYTATGSESSRKVLNVSRVS